MQKMALTPPPVCSPETGLREPEFRAAAAAGRVRGIDVYQATGDGRYFVVISLGSPSDVRYLTTQRHRDRPRLFRLWVPLAKLLRDIAPSLPFTVHPDSQLPGGFRSPGRRQ